MDEFLDGTNLLTDRGVTRIDSARGKKQVWHPMFESEVFRKQIYCIEESACDIVGTFRRPHNHSAHPQSFGAPVIIRRPPQYFSGPSDSAPVELRPLVTPLLIEP